MSEPGTLKDILDGLKKEDGMFSNDRTIVMDAGVATEENIALIRKSGYKYVVVSRKKSLKILFGLKRTKRRLCYQTENNVGHEISPY
ncbi:MAG: hypothetical protein HS127_16545 [Planctomycetia bacterium]|nr:hypothetical protein [Planctomycetia bacterium]